MNQDQMMSLLRTALKVVGTLLMAVPATSAVVTQTNWASWSDAIVTLVGAASLVAGAFASHKAHA